MEDKPELQNHYDKDVWVNKKMEELRREECLCFNCKKIGDCKYASGLYGVCKDGNIALAVTRCKHWEKKEHE